MNLKFAILLSCLSIGLLSQIAHTGVLDDENGGCALTPKAFLDEPTRTRMAVSRLRAVQFAACKGIDVSHAKVVNGRYEDGSLDPREVTIYTPSLKCYWREYEGADSAGMGVGSASPYIQCEQASPKRKLR